MEALLDERNRPLWDQLNTKFILTALPSSNEEYSVFSIDDVHTIRYVETNLCTASFTHELLHVYIRFHECFIGRCLMNTVAGSRLLSKIMSDNLLDHIGNCLDHIKMLPIYLDMGYERENFLLDYETHKCDPEELLLIEQYYRNNKKEIIPMVADGYIGRFFSMIADPNPAFDYSREMDRLRKVDPLLFQINMNMIEQWKQTPLENATIHSNYRTVISDYYASLKIWLSKNKFT